MSQSAYLDYKYHVEDCDLASITLPPSLVAAHCSKLPASAGQDERLHRYCKRSSLRYGVSVR